MRTRLEQLSSTALRVAFSLIWAAWTAGCSLLVGSFEDCQSHGDCEMPGRVCRESLCIDPCNIKSGADGDNALVLGALLPLTTKAGVHDPRGWDRLNAMDLAVGTILEIPPLSSAGANRPLRLIACDVPEGEDVEVIRKVVRHLVQNHHASAVLTMGSAETIAAAGEGIQQKVPVVTVSGTSSVLAKGNYELRDGEGVSLRGLWQMAPSDYLQGHVLASIIRHAHDVPDSTFILAVNNAYGESLMEVLSDSLGGISSEYRALFERGRDFGEVVRSMDATFSQSNPPASMVFIGNPFEVVQFFNSLVTNQSVFDKLKSKSTQFYFTDSSRNAEFSRIDARIGHFLHQTVGTASAVNEASASYMTFSNRYRSQYDRSHPGAYTGHSYDAIFVLALAACMDQSHSQSNTGLSLVRGLTDLAHIQSTVCLNGVGEAGEEPCTTYNVATSGMFSTFCKAFNKHEPVRFIGVSGPLVFNPQTGESNPWAFEMWRWTGSLVETAGYYCLDENEVWVHCHGTCSDDGYCRD